MGDARFVRVEPRAGQAQPFTLVGQTTPPTFTYDPDARAGDVVPPLMAALLAEAQDPVESSRPQRGVRAKHRARRGRRPWGFGGNAVSLVS